jgi:hypothetical protein
MAFRVAEPWIECSLAHALLAASIVTGAHLGLLHGHRRIVLYHWDMRELEDGEEDFPLQLGLRY